MFAVRTWAGWGLLLAGCCDAQPPPSPQVPLPHDLIAEWDDSWHTPPVPPEPEVLLEEGFTTGTLPDAWSHRLTPGTRASVRAVPGQAASTALVFDGTGEGSWRLGTVQRTLADPGVGRLRVTVDVLEGGLSGDALSGGPMLRVDAQGDDLPATRGMLARTVRLAHVEQPAAWTPPGEPPAWQTLTATLDLPADTQKARVELSAGRGSTTADSFVAFRHLRVERVPAAEVTASARVPVAKSLRPEAHPNLRSVRIGPTQRPSVVHPVGAHWTVPLPARQTPVQLTGHVGSTSSKTACWTISDNNGRPLSEGCTTHRRWTAIHVEVPPEATGLTFTSSADAPTSVAWARPRIWSSPTPVDRPDIVLVVIDTLRADGLGPRRSPQLHALSQDMVRYRRAFAASGWTLPSLASVVTGLWPGEHGAGFRRRAIQGGARRNSAEWKLRTFTGLDPDQPTLAERLQAAGYCTRALVTNHFFGAGYGFQRGFDRFSQYNGNTIPGAEQLGSLLAGDRTCRGPTLTVLHLFEPHMPLRLRSDAPATQGTHPEALDPLDLETETASDGRTAQVVRRLTRKNKGHPDTLRAIYDSETWHADRALGELLPQLAPVGTGLILLSDHGEHFGEPHQEVRQWGHGSTLYDELLRVPLLVRAPTPAPAATVDQPVSLVDVLPTILDWAGLPSDGLSGAPLPGPHDPQHPRDLWAAHRYSGAEAWASVHQDTLMVHILGKGTLDAHTRRGDHRWTSTTEWYALGVDRHGEPISPPDDAEQRLHRTRQHIGRSFPGVHIRCDRTHARVVELTASRGSLVRVTPVQMSTQDDVSADIAHRTLSMELTASPTPAWLVVETHPVGDMVVPEGCTAERVGGAATGASLSTEELEALEAIGYLGD